METLNKISINVYQLSKDGQNKSFNAFINLEDNKPIQRKVALKEGAKFLYKVFNSQKRISEKIGKSRFYGLASGKSTFLKVSINGITSIDTNDLKMYGSHKMKISELTESEFLFLLNEILGIYEAN